MEGEENKTIWFRRRRYGWGWVPVTWQAWLSLVVYIGIVAVLAIAVSDAVTIKEVALGFLLPIILLTAGYIRFCYAYGEEPRWQWGNEQ